MRRFLTLAVLLFASHYAMSQGPVEICNNGLDDDFDGFIDCYDGSCANNPLCDGLFLGNDAACEAVPPAFPQFTMALDFASPNETTNHLSRLAIGDLDRDGIPEMVTMNRYTNKIFILNGNNGTVKHQATVSWEPYWEVAIANIDNDACGEIYFIGYQDPPGNNNAGTYLFAYDCQLNKLWESAQRLPADPINFGIADFDGDGQEEIYAKDEIYDAKTGVRIVRTTAAQYSRFNGGPVAANIVGDDKLELIAGLNIYRVNLGARTLDAGSLTLLQSRAEYFVRNEYNATSIADYNLDGFLDVLASGSTVAHGENTTVFFWDVQNNTIKTYNDFQPALGTNYEDGWINGTGRLNIADLDGNGQMNASFVSGRFLYALDENFNLLWRVNINEETSGHTGCTLFDFNGDGKAEIVYRDERFIYIIEGTDGSVYSQQACISRTNREYPIVADVDADGSTELCVPCGFSDTDASTNFNNLNYSRYSHIRVFKSAAEPWVPARRVWNQHGYFVVNVNDDLTIPTKLQPHQLVFSTGNCTQGPNRPLNKFLNQSPYLNSEGCPTYAAPDIAFHVAPTIIPPVCPSLNFQVSFKITNLGDVALTGNIPVSFYSSDPLLAGAAKLATINIPVNGLSTGDIVSVDNQVVTGNGSAFVYVVLNDAGTSLPTPIVLPNTNFIECDYDNIRFAAINPTPNALTGLEVSPNETCAGSSNGVARAFVPTPAGENTNDYNFYWSNGTVAKPIPADYVGAVYSNIPAGTYTVYARHKTANCNTTSAQVVIGTTTAPFPPITINVLSDQTSCSPFNGSLQAVIQGGGAGYSIDWYDIALNNLGISGPIASNLRAGSYLAVVTKGTCNTSVPATVNPPSVPDAAADVLLDVVDCLNPNSGSVTADAMVSGVAQNPANYTFTWYEYDDTNNVRGSVLNAIHGTGKTRTGLPVGFYQVEVRENASQCPSTITPIVEVESELDIPDAPDIEVLSSQTSCDPALANGIMTAHAVVGGVQQNPAGFTFEWFQGQSTQPADLVTTVSGVNGKTINQVKGGGIIYTVRVTNAAHCSATAEEAITESIVSPVVTLTQLTPNSICDPALANPFNGYNGSLQASVTFNGSAVTLPDNNYVFEWRNPANTVLTPADNKNPILSGLQDGNAYSVTVRRTDVNCPSAPDTEPVLAAKVLPALDPESEPSNTCSVSATPDGSVDVTVTNSVVGQTYRYQWYTGNGAIAGNELSTLKKVENLGGPSATPHPFTVQVTNNVTGCRSTASEFVVDESVVPVISFSSIPSPNTRCDAPFNGSLTAQITNQIGLLTDYVFTWSNGSSGAGLNVLSGQQDGSYTVQVENTATGCESTIISNQIPDGRVFPTVNFAPPVGSKTCLVSKTPDGQLTALPTGGTNFSYAWTPLGTAPAPSNGLTNQSILNVGGPTFGLPAHSYSVVVTNTDNGCESTNIGQVPDLSVSPTLTLAVTPNGICDVALTSPAASNTGSLTVTAINPPVLSGTVTYTWYNATPAGVPTGSFLTTATNALSNLDDAKYGVQVTVDNLGCTSEIEVEEVLNLVTLPNIDASATPDVNCVGDNGTIQVNAVDANPVSNAVPGNYTFEWYNGPVVAGASISSVPEPAMVFAGNQTFTVEVINRTNGCVGSETVTVTDGRVTPTVDINYVQHNTICDLLNLAANGELGAVATNAGASPSFAWTPALNPTSDDPIFTALPPGNYSVEVTNSATGCVSQPDTETILNDLTYPDPNLVATAQSACIGSNGQVEADDPGGRTFTWYTGNGVVPGNQIFPDAGETNIIDDLAAGNYTVEVTITLTGCKASESAPVSTFIVPPTLALANTQPVTLCGPAPSTFTPNGAASVTLGAISAHPITGPDFEVFYIRTQVIDGVGAGTFPTDPAIVKGSAESHVGGANPSPLTNLAPGYLTAIVVDNLTGCESPVQTVSIQDNTADYLIDIIGTATAGLCNPATPGGAINVDVLKNGVTCTTCTYEWYNSTPTNSNVNFFTNPPNMVGAPIATVEDLGVTAPVGGVSAGNYTLIVRDAVNGCGAFEIENIPTANPAVVDIDLTQPTLCVNPLNPTNNGVVAVEVDKFLPAGAGSNTNGYTVNIFGANGPIGAPLSSVTNNNPADDSFTVTLSNRNSGDYFIQVIDLVPANSPCPQGFNRTLLSQAFNPSVATVATGNTTCDQLNFSDGSVQLTVTKDPLDLSADQNYAVSQIMPQPRVAVAANTIIGDGNTGASITLNTFRPVTVQADYKITVQDLISFCFTEVTVVVPEAQDLPSELTATANPETNCSDATLLNSNGNAVADLTDPADADNLFNFTWDNNADLSSPVFAPAPGVAGVPTNGEFINQAKTPATWTMGAVGQGSGDRVYFVQAEKLSGSGRACKTGIVQVVIPDEHKDPNLAIATTVDSFCNATALGGQIGDGEITIVADANPDAAGQQIPGSGGFRYSWTPVPVGSTAPPVNSAAASFVIDELGDGEYTLTVTNLENACFVTNDAIVDPAPYVIEIANRSVIDQRICTNDGVITLTNINIIDQRVTPGNNGAVVHNDADAAIDPVYTFQWFNTPAMTAGTQLTDATPTDITGRILQRNAAANLTAQPGEFPGMQAGTYYVVGRRSMTATIARDCPTQPFAVVVNDVHKNPTINLAPLSNTSCAAAGDGEIAINVLDATSNAFGAFTFNYNWTAGNGLMGTSSVGNNGNGLADGDEDVEQNLLDGATGSYAITVLNPKSGCSSTATATITKNASAIFIQNVTPAHELRCDPVLGDGSLTVTSISVSNRGGTPVAAAIGDFEFNWSRQGNPFTQVDGGVTLNNTTYDSDAAPGGFGTPIGAGTYFVVARRTSGPAGAFGMECESSPYEAVILDRRINPTVSLTPFANTACLAPFAEGSIEVRVADQTLVPGPFTFTYTWDDAGNPTPLGITLLNDGDGSALDGDNDNPQDLLHNPTATSTYQVTVRNDQSGCEGIGLTTIFQNSTPIIIPSAVPTPQVNCLNDGSIEVESVQVGGISVPDFDDIDFEWHADPFPNVIANTDGADPNGKFLNNLATGQYYVVAEQVGGDLGRGCKSAPYHVFVPDARVYPEVTIAAQAPNSSCDPLAPNGIVIANARELDGDNTDEYNFTWTLNAGAVADTEPSNSSSNLSNALDGPYLVTVLNVNTGCSVTSPFTLVLDQTRSIPNVIGVDPINPLNCNPTGAAMVTSIKIGINGPVVTQNLDDFEYEWYQGRVSDGVQLPVGGPFTTTSTINNIPVGVYFVVVVDPVTDCPSLGREVIISPDDIIYPDLNVQQTALQISCRPGIGSAELSVTADGVDDSNQATPPNYTFTWFVNDTATGLPIGTSSTLSNILHGTYSVTVHDNTTNCSISDSYIIEDDTQDFTPIVSMASQPRTLCVGTDGEIFARVLNLSPLYPYPYNANTFTADLYFGASPNLSASPDMPAIANTIGFIGNFSQNNLNQGFYTVRITDNNTGCSNVGVEEIKDARMFPTVAVEEIAPVTNCDPARPNGVAQVTANNTLVGFTFEWFEGTTASGTPVFTGANFSELKVKPQQYVVRATDNTSGCFTDATTDIENATVLPPAATIEILSHVTSCIADNGSLMAYVGPEKNTANYIFHWYDGTVENPPADNIGETYNDLAVGMYSVTATSVITGCKSPLTTEEIINKQEFPNFEFIVQNTTCDQNDGFATLILLSNVPIEKIEWSTSEGPFLTGPNFTDAGAGQYQVTATTFEGCETTKLVEIKPDIRPYNGISRNNDGRNEIFQIDCIQNFPTNLVKIFNRAGTLVYEAENYDNSSTFFDGRSNRGISPMGVNLPDGTYYYIVDKRDGTKPLAGYLEIVK